MRAYFWTNFYLSSMSHGIQAQHCTADLFVEYTNKKDNTTKVLYDWAKNHKTSIILNGGNHEGLMNVLETVGRLATNLDLPYTSFYEDLQSLNGMLTCVGLIVPEPVYTLSAMMRSGATEQEQNNYVSPYTIHAANGTSVYELAQFLTQFGLAR